MIFYTYTEVSPNIINLNRTGGFNIHMDVSSVTTSHTVDAHFVFDGDYIC